MGFLAVGARWSSGAVVPLLTRAFSSQSAGSFTAPSGLTWAGPSAYTLQTSASSLVVVAVANPGIYADGSKTGLQIEEARTNRIQYSRDVSQVAWWGGGTGATRTGLIADPAGGTGAQTVTATSGNFAYGENGDTSPAGTYVSSAWLQSTSGSAPSNFNTYRATTGRAAVSTSSPATWSRLVQAALTVNGTEQHTIVPVDGRDWSGVGGVVAGARSFNIDFMQRELGSFATSAIVCTGSAVTRTATDWKEANSGILSSGRLEMYLKFNPLGARSAYAGNMRLFTDGAAYAEINVSTGVVTVTDGTTTHTSSALTWAAGDTVEIKLRMGNGLSYLDANINSGGGTNLLTSGSSLTSLTATGNSDILSNGTSNVLSSIVQRAVWYSSGQMPATWGL